MAAPAAPARPSADAFIGVLKGIVQQYDDAALLSDGVHPGQEWLDNDIDYIRITNSDINSLTEAITDNALEWRLRGIYREVYKIENNLARSVQIMSPSWLEVPRQADEISMVATRAPDPNRVLLFRDGVALPDYDVIIVPIHRNNQWFIAVVANHARIYPALPAAAAAAPAAAAAAPANIDSAHVMYFVDMMSGPAYAALNHDLRNPFYDRCAESILKQLVDAKNASLPAGSQHYCGVVNDIRPFYTCIAVEQHADKDGRRLLTYVRQLLSLPAATVINTASLNALPVAAADPAVAVSIQASQLIESYLLDYDVSYAAILLA